MSRAKGKKYKRAKKANTNRKANAAENKGILQDEMPQEAVLPEETAATVEAIPVYRPQAESHRVSKKSKVLLAAVFITVLAAAGVFGGCRIYYANRWYAGTKIAGQDVSGMKLQEAKAVLADLYAAYELKVHGRDGGELTVGRDDIDYQSHHEAALEKAFEQQHANFSYVSLFQDNSMEVDARGTYNLEKLEQYLNDSELVNGSEEYEIVKPEDAYVSFSDMDNCLKITEEVKGNKIRKKKLLAAVQEALDNGDTEINLEEDKYSEVYKEPEVTAQDEQLHQERDLWNATVLRWFVWKVDKERKITVEPKQIFEWCTVKNDKIKFKKQEIRDWVEEICLEYKTVGLTRTFKNHKGKKISVSGGDYGWSFEYEEMVKQLMNGLKKEIDPELQEAYVEDASAENKKALTIKKDPVYSGTAFKRDYDKPENDWDKKNFTEVDLQEQMVYVWRNGKVKFKCECITGRPVEGRQTKTGVYFIKEHQEYRVLKGDDYETPVTFWVRITWTGTGFHEAHWQRWGSWSKMYYISRGSHGCINLSPENAKKIYDMVKYKEAVFIH